MMGYVDSRTGIGASVLLLVAIGNFLFGWVVRGIARNRR